METGTTTITKEQLNLFCVVGKHYVSSSEESDLTKAVEMLLPQAIKKLQKVERQKDIVRISLAKKTGSKHLEKDKFGQYMYTEEDTKKVWEAMDKIDAEEIKIPSIIVEKYPQEDVSFDMKRAFNGIVIPKIDFVNFDEEDEPETEE